MNPNDPTKIAPQMDTNEAIRRVLAVFTDSSGNLRPGVPGGPLAGKKLRITRVTARGPLPDLAALLVPADATVVARLVQNLDDTQTVWLSDNPNVTNQTGLTLKPELNLPIGFSGPIYAYTLGGSPIVEVTEVLPD